MRVLLNPIHVAVLLGSLVAVFCCSPAAYPAESADIILYKTGVDSYQKGEYGSAAASLRRLLQQFPDTPLRDVATFWLARSSYRAGDLEQAAFYIGIFCRDYPDNPLRETAEKELLGLALQTDQTIRAEAIAAEEFHRAELQRSQERMSAEMAADPIERHLAAERKIQRVRDALNSAGPKLRHQDM